MKIFETGRRVATYIIHTGTGMSKAINFCHGFMIGRYSSVYGKKVSGGLYCMHTVPRIQYTLNLRIKTEPVTDGAEYHILYCTVYSVHAYQ